jgi:hypothetical protein
MFADASSLVVTTSAPAGGPSAEGLGPTLLESALPAALGPWRLAHPEQRKGLASERR